MKKEIIIYLKAKGTPVLRAELLTHLHALGYNVSDRAMRKEVEELIKGGELIQSSERGYNLIQTEEQLQDAMAYLNSKNEAIAIRKNLLLKNWRDKYKSEPKCQPLLF